jgi:hypothetical protein
VTFNPEEPTKVTVRRFRGIQRGMDDGDIPIDQFIDARNLITDDKSGEARTRDGMLSVDDRVYTEPFAIMPGAHGASGLRAVFTPPAPAGKLQLVANPAVFEVDSSTSQTVAFTVYGGAALATTPTYSWDFHWAPGQAATADLTAANVSETHSYTDADVPDSNQATIWCRVSMTGTDSKSYEAWAQLTITRKGAVLPPTTVTPPPPPMAEGEVTISVSPESIALGDPAVVGWDSLGCASVALTGTGISSLTTLAGMKEITPSTAGTYTFGITGTPEEGVTGSPTDSCTLTVTPAEDPPEDPELEYLRFRVTLEATPATVATAANILLTAKLYSLTKYEGLPEVVEAFDFAGVPTLTVVGGTPSLWGGTKTGSTADNVCTWSQSHYDLASGVDSEDVTFEVYVDSDTTARATITVVSASSLVTIATTFKDSITKTLTGEAFEIRLEASDENFSESVPWKDTWSLLTGNASDPASGYAPTATLVAAYSDWAGTQAITMNTDGSIPGSAWKAGDAGKVMLQVQVDFPYFDAYPPDAVLYQNIRFFNNVTGDGWSVTPANLRVDCQSYFEITAPSDIYSGTEFEITVTLKDASGSADATQTGKTVTVDLNSAAGALVGTWSLTLSGSSASKSDCSCEIATEIVNDGRSMAFSAVLDDDDTVHQYQTATADPNESPELAYTLNTTTDHPAGFYGTGGDASAATAQATAISTLSGDTALASGGGTAYIPWDSHNVGVWWTGHACWPYSGQPEAYAFTAPLYFTVTEAMRLSAVSAKLIVNAIGISYVSDGSVWSLVSGVNSLKVIFTEGQQFTAGSQVIAAAANCTITDTAINALQVAAGWVASGQAAAKAISIDLGTAFADFVSEMTGDTLGIWLCPTFNSYGLAASGLRYKGLWVKGGGGTSQLEIYT